MLLTGFSEAMSAKIAVNKKPKIAIRFDLNLSKRLFAYSPVFDRFH